MKTNYKIAGSYFCGNKISEYGLKHGFVDYATLAKSFDAVLNNGIISSTAEIGYWEIVSGAEFDENDEYVDVFQWYIVSDSGAQILEDFNEIVYYNDTLDMYVWGVTHCGTSWDYVLTDVPCNCGYDAILND